MRSAVQGAEGGCWETDLGPRPHVIYRHVWAQERDGRVIRCRTGGPVAKGRQGKREAGRSPPPQGCSPPPTVLG